MGRGAGGFGSGGVVRGEDVIQAWLHEPQKRDERFSVATELFSLCFMHLFMESFKIEHD